MAKIIYLLLFLNLLFTYDLKADEKIAFIDVDKIVFNSNIGKKVDTEINTNFKKENDKLIKTEKSLISKEKDLLSKKNILSEEELKNKVNDLKKDIQIHKQNKLELSKKYREIRVKQTNLILNKLNLILSNYVEKNGITIVLKKSDVVIGKTTLDITDEVLETFNKEVTKIE